MHFPFLYFLPPSFFPSFHPPDSLASLSPFILFTSLEFNFFPFSSLPFLYFPFQSFSFLFLSFPFPPFPFLNIVFLSLSLPAFFCLPPPSSPNHFPPLHFLPSHSHPQRLSPLSPSSLHTAIPSLHQLHTSYFTSPTFHLSLSPPTCTPPQPFHPFAGNTFTSYLRPFSYASSPPPFFSSISSSICSGFPPASSVSYFTRSMYISPRIFDGKAHIVHFILFQYAKVRLLSRLCFLPDRELDIDE